MRTLFFNPLRATAVSEDFAWIVVAFVAAFATSNNMIGCTAAPPRGQSDPDAIFVSVDDPESEVVGIVSGPQGDSIGLVGKRDAAGDPTTITSVNYQLDAASSFTVFFGEDGLPSYMVVGDWTLQFSNYTNDSVDVLVIGATGEAVTVTGVAVDDGPLAELRSLASSGLTRSTAKRTYSSVPKITGVQMKLTASRIWQIGGTIISFAGCAGSLAMAGTGIGIALPILGCAGTVGSLLNLFLNNDALGAAGIAVGTVKCASGIAQVNVFSIAASCGSLTLGVASRVARDAEQTSELPTDSDDGGVPGSDESDDLPPPLEDQPPPSVESPSITDHIRTACAAYSESELARKILFYDAERLSGRSLSSALNRSESECFSYSFSGIRCGDLDGNDCEDMCQTCEATVIDLIYNPSFSVYGRITTSIRTACALYSEPELARKLLFYDSERLSGRSLSSALNLSASECFSYSFSGIRCGDLDGNDCEDMCQTCDAAVISLVYGN